jgi:dihydrolipoamide dehydrogenase
VAESTGTVFDVVILGGGSGGYACALRAAHIPLNVALIERDKVGGTCLHRGCIPTKALLHAAEVADQTRESEQFGIKASLDGIDMAGLSSYKDGVVTKMYKGLQGLIRAAKITYVEGTGRLVSPTAVEVDTTSGTQLFEGRHVVLATGSAPKSLPGLEIDGDRVISSEHALKLDHVPESAIIPRWRSHRRGVRIGLAVLRRRDHRDRGASASAAHGGRGEFQAARAGVPAARHRLRGRRTFLRHGADRDGVRVSTENGKDLRGGATLAFAVGRGPVSEGLGYPEVGVELEGGYVKVDALSARRISRPSQPSGPDPHAAARPCRVRRGHPGRRADRRVEPSAHRLRRGARVTYSEPEVASMGLTELARARALRKTTTSHLRVRPSAATAGSQILRTSGAVKVVRQKDGPVVGIPMVGSRMGELVSEAQLI